MNLPNSGWKTGAGFSFALSAVSTNEIEFDVATSLGIPGLKVRHSASLLQKLLVIGKRS